MGDRSDDGGGDSGGLDDEDVFVEVTAARFLTALGRTPPSGLA
jgi:hypothetical protein